jgi:Carbamoyltransferase C-terminus/ASCH domain
MEAKEREDFMPFAPSILREHAHEYFNPPVESPYMLLTADAKSYKKNLIPGVLHAEKNSRLQTVSLEDNPAFYGLLQEYMNITGIPLVINTSFNKKGSPIVETPLDALEMFRSMDIDILVLNNLIVKKKGIHKKIAKVIMQAERKTVYNPELRQVVYDLSSITINQLRHSLKSDFPDYQLIPKSNLTLFNEYVKLLKDGRKVTTIRYRFKALHHPDDLILALEDTGISGAKDGEAEYTCKVKVTQYMVKPFGWLNTEDAKKDGFTSEEQLKIALQQIYGPIQPVEYVSIYTVELV